jgi:hypothetical protein
MTAANSKMVLIALDRYEQLTSSNQKSTISDERTIPKPNSFTDQSETADCKDTLTEDNILEFIPSRFQTKAKLILRHMKTHDITWDNCGRLVLDNDCIVDANIMEILKDVVTMDNEKIKSNSSKQFYKLLILTNFPVSLLNLRDDDNTESSGEKNPEKSLL